MKNLMTYKGYYGSSYFSEGDECFHGKIEFIKALVTYEAKHSNELKIAFEHAVDDYSTLLRHPSYRNF